MVRRIDVARWAVGVALAVACACGGEPPREHARAGASDRETRVSAGGWSGDPRHVELRRAIGEGRLDQARALHQQLEASGGGGIEALLLGARVAALGGDEVEASRRIEEARAAAPRDARVYATAAELHAAAGRMETADAEIQRGLAAAGACAELERARGVYLICSPGGARAGLDLLETARAHDSALPFLARPLGQAHLLVGKERAREGDLLGALQHAKQSVDHDPADVDGRRFLAESAAALLAYGDAIAIYEDLLAEGVDVGVQAAQAYKNGAIAALASGAREEAVRFFLRARELGMDGDALGSGVGVLRDEARAAAAAALAAQDAGDGDTGAEHVARALRHDPAIGADLVARAARALERGEWSEAETLARQARLVAADDALARVIPALAAARAALEADDLAGAQARVRAALDAEPDNAALAAERAWLMALEAHASREVEHAADLAKAALAHAPDHARAHELLATLHVEQGFAHLEARRLDAAAESLRAALEHDPGRIEAHQFLGVTLYDAGDHAGAARAFEAVLAIARAEDLELPEPVHVQLAKSLYLAGDAARARETLEDYLAAHPAGPFLDETRAVLESLPQPEPPGPVVEDETRG